MRRKLHFIIAFFILVNTSIFCDSYFSGYSGAKINFGSQDSDVFTPQLKLQAFFAGQLNFTPNLWSHLEFSLDTGNLISESIFRESESIFMIDELSLIGRIPLSNSMNYLSFFLGKYDPIGTDIFLQRYFSIKPIASKITENYLGFAGSNLYPLSGVGIADVIRPQSIPIAGGIYIYLNHEDDDYYVFNTDLRFAGSLQYFTWDLAGGVGFPIIDDNNEEYADLLFAVKELYWHAGTTILFGNHYTNGLFLQGGLYNAGLKKKGNLEISGDDIYFIFEPRFITHNFHTNISLYAIPSKTVRSLLFVDGNLGADLNIYSEDIKIGRKFFTIGCHISTALKDITIMDLADMETINSFSTDSLSANITPYTTTDFLGGELHFMASVKLMEILRQNPCNIVTLDLGFRTTF